MIRRIAGLNEEQDWDYLLIRMENGKLCHGGDQGWWTTPDQQDDTKSILPKTNPSKYRRASRDERFRISFLGCGVIAMNNLEWYLSAKELGRKHAGGESTQAQYMEQVRQNWNREYYISGNPINQLAGLYPWKMERGLTAFLAEHHCRWRKVKWAPYWNRKPQKQRKLVLELIQNMLEAGLPVVCSYHTFDPKRKSLILYHSPEAAADVGALEDRGGQDAKAGFLKQNAEKRQQMQGRTGSVKESKRTRINSHYMTIIGLYSFDMEEDLENSEIDFLKAESSKNDLLKGENWRNALLKVESWGRIYYVRFRDYAANLNYFTNILSIQ